MLFGMMKNRSVQTVRVHVCVLLIVTRVVYIIYMLTTTGFQYLADIEEHLGVTIPVTDRSIKVEANEFDGKVVYGEKRYEKGKS